MSAPEGEFHERQSDTSRVHTIAPNVIVKSVDAAVSFYKRAFGAEEIMRLSMPNGKVVIVN
jgi:hypothetical protein